MRQHVANLHDLILQLLPKDGSSIGNIKLQQQLTEAAAFSFSEKDYWRVRDALIADGVLGKGQGRGGSVFLAQLQRASLHLWQNRYWLSIVHKLKTTR
nr:hypothetical protein [Pseudomonas syringae]